MSAISFVKWLSIKCCHVYTSDNGVNRFIIMNANYPNVFCEFSKNII